MASTLPSTGRKPTLPKLLAITLAGVNIVSCKFCPVRCTSLCHVVTSTAGAGGGLNVVAIGLELELLQQVKPSARNTDAMSTDARFVHTDPHVTARQPKGPHQPNLLARL